MNLTVTPCYAFTFQSFLQISLRLLSQALEIISKPQFHVKATEYFCLS